MDEHLDPKAFLSQPGLRLDGQPGAALVACAALAKPRQAIPHPS